MSVDNFIIRNSIDECFRIVGLVETVKRFFMHKITFTGYWKYMTDDISYLYQSEYAHDYLIKHGKKNCYRLSDYINPIYISDQERFENKEDIVLYNPKKGKKFTEKIIHTSPQLKWIAIENLSTEEVYKLLQRGKVYIDFGNHPGKDRFPREAAISGCCIITGKRGAAAYYKDIPIDDEFKFEDVDSSISQIISKIENCLNNYENEIKKFYEYRCYIRSEYKLFIDDVNYLIGKK